MPTGMENDHNWPLRFLTDCDYDNQLAYDYLLKNEAWMRMSMIPKFKDSE